MESCRDRLERILEETAKQHGIPEQAYRIRAVKPRKPQRQGHEAKEKHTEQGETRGEQPIEKQPTNEPKETHNQELVPVKIQGQTIYLTKQEHQKYQKLTRLGYEPRLNPQNNEIILEKKGRKTRIKPTQPQQKQKTKQHNNDLQRTPTDTSIHKQ